MVMSCRALFGGILTAVLLVSVCATSAAAAPTFSVAWEVPLEPGFFAALVSEGVVFQVNQTQVPMGAYNDTLIATTTNQSLWTLQSSGPIESIIAVYAFSAIPKLIFVLFNNMQQPNISAVIPTTGTVVWSTVCPFNVSYIPGNLMVSLDGTALYWFITSPESTLGLTALDAEYGTVLWSEIVPDNNTTQPLQCGPLHSNCLGIFDGSTPVILFLDGRTRAVLGEMQLPGNTPQAPQINGLSQVAPDLVLVSGYYENAAINTTNFTVLSSWTVPEPGIPPQTLVQPMPPGAPTTLAVIEMLGQGIYAVDLFTGSSLWTTNASALCPCVNPEPGCAYYSQLMLPQAPFNGAGEVIPFEAVCYYANEPDICIVGLLNLTTGVLVKSVVSNTSHKTLLEQIFAPIGLGSFVTGNDFGGAAFYDTNLTVLAVYPPTNSPCGDATTITVQGNAVVFTLWCLSERRGRVVVGVVSE